MRPVYVAKNPHEKRMQRALMQYYLPRNFGLIRQALRQADREDLIGYGKDCLVPPEYRKPGKNAVDKSRRNR